MIVPPAGISSGSSPAAAEFEGLEAVAGLIACADLYIGNDSGLTHMAAALGAPTVAVFGPTDPGTWRPLGRVVRVLRGAASPDNPARWPGVDEVLEAVLASADILEP